MTYCLTTPSHYLNILTNVDLSFDIHLMADSQKLIQNMQSHFFFIYDTFEIEATYLRGQWVNIDLTDFLCILGGGSFLAWLASKQASRRRLVIKSTAHSPLPTFLGENTVDWGCLHWKRSLSCNIYSYNDCKPQNSDMFETFNNSYGLKEHSQKLNNLISCHMSQVADQEVPATHDWTRIVAWQFACDHRFSRTDVCQLWRSQDT